MSDSWIKTDAFSTDGLDGLDGLDGSDGSDGLNKSVLGTVLDRLRQWHARFVATTSEADLDLIVLFEASTHVCRETYTTPRIVIDSIAPGSGKTTLLEHMARFCAHPLQAASLSSPALLARVLANGPRTILIDEADRTLDPKNPNTSDLIAILNSGYKRGATRPVLVPVKGGGWDVEEMTTFAPVVMAGNAPNLPDDTRQRSVRILLMPSTDGTIWPSDWEDIEEEADKLAITLTETMDTVRDLISASNPELPQGCVGRIREKWRPLARVADVAGGPWPAKVKELIMRDMEEIEAERADGLTKQPPAVTLIHDIHSVWPNGEPFTKTSQLVQALIFHRPDYWGAASSYGRDLTVQRLGRMLAQGAKIHSSKQAGERGYYRTAFSLVWQRMGIEQPQSGSKDGSTDTPKQTVRTVQTVQTVQHRQAGTAEDPAALGRRLREQVRAHESTTLQ